MQSLLCAGPIWGGIQQPSGRVQPNAAPVKLPTSMSLCWILMSVCLKTLKLVLVTYVCVGYLCQSLIRMRLMFVLDTCVEHLCLWWIFMFVLAIYVCDDICDVYMWYIYVISFVCVDGIQKTNKKGAYWSLCRVLHSAKRLFAECLGHNTRQGAQTWTPA